MTAFLAWLKSKNVTSHSIALGAFALAGLITKDAQVIEATPDPPPPTQAAVDAAKPSKETP